MFPPDDKQGRRKPPEKRKLWAHLLPMLTFVLLLGVSGALKRPGASLWLSAPELWIYPLQTVLVRRFPDFLLARI